MRMPSLPRVAAHRTIAAGSANTIAHANAPKEIAPRRGVRKMISPPRAFPAGCGDGVRPPARVIAD